jgi:hypothetical protein
MQTQLKPTSVERFPLSIQLPPEACELPTDGQKKGVSSPYLPPHTISNIQEIGLLVEFARKMILTVEIVSERGSRKVVRSRPRHPPPLSSPLPPAPPPDWVQTTRLGCRSTPTPQHHHHANPRRNVNSLTPLFTPK